MNNLLVLSAISFLRHCKIRMKKSRFQLFTCFSLALVATRARYGDKTASPPQNLSPQGITEGRFFCDSACHRRTVPVLQGPGVKT